MKIQKALSVVLTAIVLTGCTGGKLKIDASGNASPWTHLNLYNNPDNFHFAIVADRTGGHQPGIFEDAVQKLNLLKPQFVLCVGDLVEGDADDPNRAQQQWSEFDAIVDKLEMPFFYLPGNHDITNPLMAQTWQQRLGKTYYHFVYRNCLFLFLNTEDPPPRSISPDQIEYFRKTLAADKSVRWTFVLMHEPLWKGKSARYWEEFETLLDDRPYTVFAGHDHNYNKSVINGRSFYILGTTGGFLDESVPRRDHFVWVTMTEKGPVLANLLLDGIAGDQLPTRN